MGWNNIKRPANNKRVQEGSVILYGEMDALENAGKRFPFTKSMLSIQRFLRVPCVRGAYYYMVPQK